MPDEQFIFTDRYQALGIPYPDPDTVCKGPCEGTGVYPLMNNDFATGMLKMRDELTATDLDLWNAQHNAPNAHATEPCDGWHFVKCPDCDGTGKAIAK